MFEINIMYVKYDLSYVTWQSLGGVKGGGGGSAARHLYSYIVWTQSVLHVVNKSSSSFKDTVWREIKSTKNKMKIPSISHTGEQIVP